MLFLSGWSGLLAAKHCKEHGLNVHILEKKGHHGGVWKYEQDVPGGVMKSTQTTSSWSFTEISGTYKRFFDVPVYKSKS